MKNELTELPSVTDLTIKNVDVNLIDKIDHELLGSGISRDTFLSMQLTIIVNQLHITQHEKRLSDRLELNSQCLKTVMNDSTETTKMLERILREIKKLQ